MKLKLLPLNLYRERGGEGKCVGIGLQVLTKTVCSLIFNLQHHWTRSLSRCCQTIECLRPCTPGMVFLKQSGELWFYFVFYPCQNLFNIRFTVVFFWFWPTNASGAGQYISQATTLLCIWSLQNPRSPSFSLNITSQLRLKWQEC